MRVKIEFEVDGVANLNSAKHLFSAVEMAVSDAGFGTPRIVMTDLDTGGSVDAITEWNEDEDKYDVK